MMPQDQLQELSRSSTTTESTVHEEVINGLLAAKKYESSKPKLTPAQQEAMMTINFPRLPEGDTAKLLSNDECQQLRSSLQDSASKRTTQSIANLRDQLTEYHALLDKLTEMTSKYEALEKMFQERGDRIQTLEQEVETLKSSNCPVRRVSCSVEQAMLPVAGVDVDVSCYQPVQPQAQVPMHMQAYQQPQQASNDLAFYQSNNYSSIQNHQSPFVSLNVSSTTVDSNPFGRIEQLPTRPAIQQIISPLQTSMSCQLSNDAFSLSYADCGSGPVSASSRPKRAISNEFSYALSSGMVTDFPQNSQDNKRMKTGVHSAQGSIQQFQLP